MLSLVVTLVVSQSPFIQRYAAGRATVEDLWALEHGAKFSKKDLAALEALASTASRAPGSGAACLHWKPRECSRGISACMGPFAYIFAAVERRGQSTPQFLAWAEEIVREGKDELALPPARRMLTSAKHPSTEASALRLLRIGGYSCIEEATRMLAQVPTLSDGARGLLGAAMSGSAASRSVAGLLASRDEPWAQSLALEAMGSADAGLRMGIIRGLRKSAAPELKAAVNFAASCDVVQQLQQEARHHLKAVGAKVTPVKCPAPTWKVENDEVTDGQTRVKLHSGSTVDACDGGLGLYAGHCIGALDFGEFGGALGMVTADGGLQRFAEDDFLNPRALVQQGPDTLVVSTLAHLSGSGGVGVLRPAEDGGVLYQATLHFMGEPTAWAATGERLFVAFPAGELTAPCGYAPKKSVVMIYERDGGASIAESPTSACLWRRQR